MATAVNTVPVFALAGATLSFMTAAATPAAVSGYISPNLTDCSCTHTVTVDKTPGQTGDTAMITFSDEKLELAISFILAGTTLANARASGQLPQIGAEVKITGAAEIIIGSFVNASSTANSKGAFNSPGSAESGPRWIYEGGGSIEMSSTGKAVGKMTLYKYASWTGTSIPSVTL